MSVAAAAAGDVDGVGLVLSAVQMESASATVSALRLCWLIA